jgi:hypothetical protein
MLCASEDQLMRRSLAIASVFWLAACAQASAGAWFTKPVDNDPFEFGMTKHEVERVADAPLIYLSGRRGSERYLIERNATVPGLYPVGAHIVLQFRGGRLAGWRRDWQMRPYWF